MPVATLLLTAEEFGRLPHRKHTELINAEVNYVRPPNPMHGMITLKFARLLGEWLEQSKAGIAGTDGFILARNPDRVRGPDV
jgi:Uma2 family endonuclease